MTLTRKDAVASVLAVLVVAVYVANTHSWAFLANNRWAAAWIGVMGFATCSLGRPGERRDVTTMILSALGIGALALLVLALVTGSQAALGGLALVTLALWAATTARHAVVDRRAHAV
jgi:hypothetical protein